MTDPEFDLRLEPDHDASADSRPGAEPGPEPGPEPADDRPDPTEAGLDEIVETLRSDLASARAETKAEARHARTLEGELARQREQLDEQIRTYQDEQRDLLGRVERSESDLEAARQSGQRTEGKLQATARKLADAEALAAHCQETIEHHEAANADAVRHVELLREAMARFEATLDDVRQASQRVNAVQRNLRALEALWVEANDWVEEAERSDPSSYDQAMLQRDGVGERLELAHAERDEAVAGLQTMVERLDQTNLPPPWQPPPPPAAPRRASLAKRVIKAISS